MTYYYKDDIDEVLTIVATEENPVLEDRHWNMIAEILTDYKDTLSTHD